MVSSQIRIMLVGIPMTPAERIAGAIFYSATEPDQTMNGSTWLVQSDAPVLRLEPQMMTTGIYDVINERNKLVGRCD
jgi:hypothetical protein